MKTKLVLIIALLLGFFVRAYQYQERFIYTHDNDLASWIVKDIVVNHHLRLIGQLTSSPGIFIGPLFYYTLIPFYLATGMDPIGSVAYSWIVGLLAIASIWYVFKTLFSNRLAAIGSLLYAVSWSIAGNEREVVPTTPVFLWTIWFFYAINRLFRGHKSALWIVAVLFALVWHIHLALILVAPLVLIAVWQHRRTYNFKDILLPMLLCLVLSAPLVVFEARHNFNQLRALAYTFTPKDSSDPVDYAAKVNHVQQYVVHNANWLFFWDLSSSKVNFYLIPGLLLFSITFFVLRKKLPLYMLVMYVVWFTAFMVFFTVHRINLSEYYLNGLNILWLFAAAFLLAQLPVILSAAALAYFLVFNLNTFLTFPINHIAYPQKKALSQFIAADAKAHGYPCVAVSYMTDPGYDFGFRYWFYLAKLHVNQSKSNSPVYTIVFPHPRANRLDKTFGAYGLIFPDYAKYTPEAVATSCSGADSNLTDPLFGYTQ